MHIPIYTYDSNLKSQEIILKEKNLELEEKLKNEININKTTEIFLLQAAVSISNDQDIYHNESTDNVYENKNSLKELSDVINSVIKKNKLNIKNVTMEKNTLSTDLTTAMSELSVIQNDYILLLSTDEKISTEYTTYKREQMKIEEEYEDIIKEKQKNIVSNNKIIEELKLKIKENEENNQQSSHQNLQQTSLLNAIAIKDEKITLLQTSLFDITLLYKELSDLPILLQESDENLIKNKEIIIEISRKLLSFEDENR